MTDEELANIEGRLARRGAVGTEYENMPKDVFHHIVSAGELSGRDLIAICSASRKVRAKCDDALMRRLLQKEFGLYFSPVIRGIKGADTMNPFETYVLMHRVKYSLEFILAEAELLLSNERHQGRVGTFRFSVKKLRPRIVFVWMYQIGFLSELFNSPKGRRTIQLYDTISNSPSDIYDSPESREFIRNVHDILQTNISDDELERMIKRKVTDIDQLTLDSVVALHKLIKYGVIAYTEYTEDFRRIFSPR